MALHALARFVVASIVFALSQTWSHNASAGCQDTEYTNSDSQWARQCLQAGIFTLESQCDSAGWKEAKQNIDWVLFRDAGAKDSYLGGVGEIDQCGIAEPSASYASYHALLRAQRHNRRAQCSIALCRQEFTASNGYYNALDKAGKMPQLQASPRRSPSGPRNDDFRCGGYFNCSWD